MVARGLILVAVICQVALGVHSTANPAANAKTKSVLAMLTNIQGKKLMSGAFGGYTNVGDENGFSMGQADGIHKASSKFPAVYGLDCSHGWSKTAPGKEWSIIECMNNAAVAYAGRGGLIAISHHLPNPVFPGNDWGGPESGLKKQISNAQYALILKPGTPERQRWISIMDRIAAGLAAYQAKGITVLYRPLHEMNGEWFWWGATGYNTNDQQRMNLFKNLYRDMFNHFKAKGLNNLLWVYSPDAKREFKASFYPGPQFVDIVGLDMYLDNPDNLAGYNEMLGLGKPFALPEVGPETLNGQFDYTRMVNTILSKFPKTTFFMPWNAGWSPLKNKNLQGAYNNPRVANLGEFRF